MPTQTPSRRSGVYWSASGATAERRCRELVPAKSFLCAYRFRPEDGTCRADARVCEPLLVQGGRRNCGGAHAAAPAHATTRGVAQFRLGPVRRPAARARRSDGAERDPGPPGGSTGPRGMAAVRDPAAQARPRHGRGAGPLACFCSRARAPAPPLFRRGCLGAKPRRARPRDTSHALPPGLVRCALGWKGWQRGGLGGEAWGRPRHAISTPWHPGEHFRVQALADGAADRSSGHLRRKCGRA